MGGGRSIHALSPSALCVVSIVYAEGPPRMCAGGPDWLKATVGLYASSTRLPIDELQHWN